MLMTRGRIIAIICIALAVIIAFLIVLFSVIIPNSRYNDAVELYDAGNYDEAIAAFKAMNGYRDSEELLENCYIGKYGEETYNLVRSIQNGQEYVFGSYEQDNDPSNGKEDIEWIVLDRDGVSLLLMSRYALDCQVYNNSYASVSWETCSARNWLNSTFINEAFTAQEQSRIISTNIEADKKMKYSQSPGSNTTDKVFLIGVDEIQHYYNSMGPRQCVGTPYCYAQAPVETENGNCCWLLRSAGYISYYAAYVSGTGLVYTNGSPVSVSISAIRPVLWINLAS